MPWRRLVAALVLLIAGWLLWRAIHPVSLLISRGSELGPALFEPPTSAWRVAAALLCFIGGAIALMGRAGGAWVTALGTLLFGLLAATLAILAGDMVRWQADVAASALLLVMTLALFFLRRT
jgi:hypothetical protein